jgi:hypothetical protein
MKPKPIEADTSQVPLGTDELDLWNREDSAELNRSKDPQHFNVTIAARDWTVETIVQQVKQGNIDLDPAFQRRNAWKDSRRSRLIESFILGFPVPQIVLAENPHQKRTFIVIDGKQRLMTIAGLYLPAYRGYWTHPELSGLNILTGLNDTRLDTFLTHADFLSERRQLGNADVRTAVITGFSDEDVLYDIFYRINTGSVPLSSQELRQVLNRGAFSKFLIEITSQKNPLWQVLGVTEPDARLRDVELLLRLTAWRLRPKKYVGNMKPFLDETMRDLNKSWEGVGATIEDLSEDILAGVDAVYQVFGENAGRKFKGGAYERALNRAVFEVEAFYFSFRVIRSAALSRKKALLNGFEELSRDQDFIASIEATTKSIENYKTRFDKYRQMLHRTLGVNTEPLPLGSASRK